MPGRQHRLDQSPHAPKDAKIGFVVRTRDPEDIDLPERVARAAGVPVRLEHGLALISADDAAAFLDACEAAGVTVLGIDGYGPDGRPDLQVIAECPSVADARQFVASVRRPGLLLDFTLEP